MNIPLKSALAFGFIMSSALAFATPATPAASASCPTLTGTYSCTSDQGKSDLAISQTLVNNMVMYSQTQDGDTEQDPTDNFTYPFTDEQNNVSGTMRYDCENGAFVSYMAAQQSDGKNVVGSFVLIQSMSLTASGDLQIVTQGKISQDGKTQSEPPQPSVCPREGRALPSGQTILNDIGSYFLRLKRSI